MPPDDPAPSNSASRPTIPGPAVKRLCLYLRELESFAETGQTTVSSKQLGELLGLTDAQVRKDLAYFGQFGQPGIGYEVAPLVTELRRVLGTDKPWHVALVGVGNLGRALIAHAGFEKKGFHIKAVFDSNPALAGESIHGRKVLPMKDLKRTIQRQGIRLGVIAVPAPAAQAVCDKLVAAGVKGVINFAPKRLRVDPEVSIVSVDLAVQLEQLAFQVSLLTPGDGAS
ncbi:MAG: redox-sensing transcriptional repressor Rex [Phycisphaerales bacterium]